MFEDVDSGNVWMVQRGEDFSFALETSEPIVVSRERGGKDLDRDLTLKLGVGRPIHLPHPAFADRRRDVVDAEARARIEGQTAGSIAVGVARTRSILCDGAGFTEPVDPTSPPDRPPRGTAGTRDGFVSLADGHRGTDDLPRLTAMEDSL